MPEYKRIISYIYTYEEGERKGNTGFVKAEVRDRECKITIQLKKNPQEQTSYKAYLFAERDDKIEGIFLGRLGPEGTGMLWKGKLSLDQIKGIAATLEDTGGILIEGPKQQKYASQWEDNLVNVDSFHIYEESEVIEEKSGEPIETAKRPDEWKEELENLEEPIEAAKGSDERKEELENQGEPIEAAKRPDEWKEELKKPGEPVEAAKGSDERKEELENLGKPETLERSEELIKASENPEEPIKASENPEKLQEPIKISENLEEPIKAAKNPEEPPEPVKVMENLEEPIKAAEIPESEKSREEEPLQRDVMRKVAEMVAGSQRPGTVDVAEKSGTTEMPAMADLRETMETPQEAATASRMSAQSMEGAQQREDTGKRVDTRQEKWEYLVRHFPVQQLYQSGKPPMACIRIGPRDLQRLPRGSWVLGNNSFLLHGYYQFRHLLLCRQEQEGKVVFYLGVPGIYSEKEEMMAELFGFEEFRRSRGPGNRNGNFGYWFRRVEEV